MRREHCRMHTTPPISSRDHCDHSRWLRLVVVVLLASLTVSCRAITRNPYDRIEAELRTRERELAETRAELENARLLNDAYSRSPRFPATTDEGPLPFQPLKEIVIGSGTGGVDNDQLPGDEALKVIVVPRDGDASAVKVPANVTVFAYEIAKNGTKTAIGRWDVSADVLRRTWKSGIFSTGYYLALQWDQLPVHERVRVQVRFQTLDGRVFEADRDITVRLVPGGGRENCRPGPWIPPPIVPTVPSVVPGQQPENEILPLPMEHRKFRPVTISPARPGGNDR